MPPKPKCTREEIVKAAFDMTRESGIESVAARELGKRLGTSATPIFTHFGSMHELTQEVRKLAMKEFENYVADAVNYSPAFKQFGVRMIAFAKNEPKLFQLLYMQEHEKSHSFDYVYEKLGDAAGVCISILCRDYGLTNEEAHVVFRQVWMQTFSVCIMEANKICHFSEDEISEILGLEFQGVLMLVKSGQYKDGKVSKVQ